MIRAVTAIVALWCTAIYGTDTGGEDVPPAGGWRAGTHYQVLSPPQPTHASAGNVEVLEFFSYECPHCNALEPHLSGWLAAKPEHVEFTRIPVPWGQGRSYARLYCTLQVLRRTDLHSKVFHTLFSEGHPLVAADDAATEDLQRGFARAQGITEADFRKAYRSAAVEECLGRADEAATAYRIEGVPTLVVNGKYLSDDDRAHGKGNLVELVKYLTGQECQASAQAAASADWYCSEGRFPAGRRTPCPERHRQVALSGVLDYASSLCLSRDTTGATCGRDASF